MSASFQSIAIAGAWGYIGGRLLDAAARQGLRVQVFDPGPQPPELSAAAFTRITSETEFYQLPADLFHLALHPGVRRVGQDFLLRRAQTEPLCILNEKPIVSPEAPEDGPRLIAAVDAGQGLMLYNFLELFDPLTRRITEYLAGFRRVEIASIQMERSKDREDPAIPRNYKWMLPIQYQESVHCLAFVLHLLAHIRGGFDAALADGLTATAKSETYQPPNPDAYAYVVDGRCEFELKLGLLAVNGRTDFKCGAPWSKRRFIHGRGDGRPFVIEADYQDGRKYLRINGEDQSWEPGASTYDAILTTFSEWHRTVPRAQLLRGNYPNPRLAWLAFQMSNVLWKSGYDRRTIKLANGAALANFDSGFAAARAHFPRYLAGEHRP